MRSNHHRDESKNDDILPAGAIPHFEEVEFEPAVKHHLDHSTLVFSIKADHVYFTGASHHRQARIRCQRKRSIMV